MHLSITGESGLRDLLDIIAEPASATALSEARWNDVLRRAHAHGLAGRLEADLRRASLLDALPPKARAHLLAGAIASRSTHTATRFEIDRIRRVLAWCDVDAPLIALKGAAYLVADLDAARGRVIGDLDLMVSLESIDEVAQALLSNGWVGTELSEYDERYYREWMHEIPPIRHSQRETWVDLHHTILPRTARVRPATAKLHEDAVPVGDGSLRVLAPADMVLHGAVHLFNGESGKPLRDLLDQHELLVQFGRNPGFWDSLLARAELHGLGRTAYYALRYSATIFRSPVPAEVLRAARRWRPAPGLHAAMDRLLVAYLLSVPGGLAEWKSPTVDTLMLARSHWLKMPFGMLVRHLGVKLQARREQQRAEQTARAE